VSDYREFQDGEVVPGTRYRVTRLIGAGGMGRVYEVEHIELGKRFVLKALQRELLRRDDLVARLRNEWRALARLEHPNIVNVTDAGTSANGVPFYVMERLEGETLAALLHRQRRLLPQHALAIAAGILDGLHAAHQIGVVHRDVKPPNIFLTAPTQVKVLDFGIAKIRDAKDVITARGIAVGTPRYMSPEQAHGAAVDARSDIYATALMLFEMVSGVGPFDDARDHNELLLAHLGRPAPLLSSISVVAPELDAIVAGMLAKDPRERPGSARQVAETLRALSLRYVSYVRTDAPTASAATSAQRPEPTTRMDGRRASEPALGPTRPDGVAAWGRSPSADTTTAQPGLELATTAAHAVPPSSNITLRLPDVAHAATLYGPDTLVDSITKAPTFVPPAQPERTEMLLTVPLAPGARAATDPGPTRTAVPLAEAPNVTPPPVVPSLSMAQPSKAHSGNGLRFGAAGLALLLLASGALALRAGRAPAAVKARTAGGAPPALRTEPRPAVGAAEPVARAPVTPSVGLAPEPTPEAPSPAAAPTAVVAAPVGVAAGPISVAAAASVTPRNFAKKHPFLTPAPVPSSVQPPKAKAKPEPAMPSSGL